MTIWNFTCKSTSIGGSPMKVRPKRFSSEYSAESVTCIVAWMKWLDRTGLDERRMIPKWRLLYHIPSVLVARSCHDVMAAIACSVGLDSYPSSQSVKHNPRSMNCRLQLNERYFSKQSSMHVILRMMIVQIHLQILNATLSAITASTCMQQCRIMVKAGEMEN